MLHTPRDFLLLALIAGCSLSLIATPLSGHLSDRIGRKRWYLIGAIAMGIFGFIYFAMLNSLVPGLIFLGIMLSFVMHGLLYGPQAALIAECFTPRLRYSGCSIGYHLASITSADPRPSSRRHCWRGPDQVTRLPGTSLPAQLVSIIATMLMPDYTNRDISQEHA